MDFNVENWANARLASSQQNAAIRYNYVYTIHSYVCVILVWHKVSITLVCTITAITQTGEYIAGWNTKVTPLGYKLISLNAAMNGLSELQQAAVWVDWVYSVLQ